jgi:hypothetical protein
MSENASLNCWICAVWNSENTPDGSRRLMRVLGERNPEGRGERALGYDIEAKGSMLGRRRDQFNARRHHNITIANIPLPLACLGLLRLWIRSLHHSTR